jgi:hydrogenase expression/formation protein HypC
MCLAVPAKVVEIVNDDAVVEIDGIRRSTKIALIPDLAVGDYVIIHAGFAIQKWSEEDVQEYNQIMDEMRALDQAERGRS